MKAARLFGIGDVRIVEEEAPVAGPGECLVRVTAVGLCGSDLHWFGEGGIGDAVLDRPLALGHEMAGVVLDGPRAGQRVAIDPAVACRACEFCLGGHPNLCRNLRFAGHGSTDGGLREVIAWPEHLLHPLPDTVSDAGGAVLEPLGVALHGLDLAHLRVGATVAVVGCGPIGLLTIQLARVAGAARVVAVEPRAHRRAAALAAGADAVYAPAASAAFPASAAPDSEIDSVADVAFEIAGTDAAVESAMRACRPGGKVVLAGIPDDDRTSFPASLARRKGLTLLLVRRMREMYPRTTALAASRAIDVESLVTARYPLERTAEAFAAATAREGLKTVVEVS
ncbi:alcohol dehydrogenase catalytic domain-containing protein [Dactylosporangium sp. NPDC005572]|uniref:alcohol dehydrogenase catalytic domain-containing protein n=1 Tax=Dactylosporangium sp. NPDC005572 TaxID=3156889 RepID=UPI0033A812A8